MKMTKIQTIHAALLLAVSVSAVADQNGGIQALISADYQTLARLK